MSEIRERLYPFRVDKSCEVCGEGRMRSTGMMLTIDPPLYPHVCNRCGDGEEFRSVYPTIEYLTEAEINERQAAESEQKDG